MHLHCIWDYFHVQLVFYELETRICSLTVTPPYSSQAIFQRCGPITDSKVTQPQEPVIVRVTFKNEKDAQAAVAKFNGQPADGRTLEVKIVGGINTQLIGRLGVSATDDSVDALMVDSSSNSGSYVFMFDDLEKPRVDWPRFVLLYYVLVTENSGQTKFSREITGRWCLLLHLVRIRRSIRRRHRVVVVEVEGAVVVADGAEVGGEATMARAWISIEQLFDHRRGLIQVNIGPISPHSVLYLQGRFVCFFVDQNPRLVIVILSCLLFPDHNFLLLLYISPGVVITH